MSPHRESDAGARFLIRAQPHPPARITIQQATVFYLPSTRSPRQTPGFGLTGLWAYSDILHTSALAGQAIGKVYGWASPGFFRMFGTELSLIHPSSSSACRSPIVCSLFSPYLMYRHTRCSCPYRNKRSHRNGDACPLAPHFDKPRVGTRTKNVMATTKKQRRPGTLSETPLQEIKTNDYLTNTFL